MGTKTEYRLVTERPAAHQDGRHQKVYPKRTYELARKSLTDWHRDMKRYDSVGLPPWHAHLETREVSDWERIDFGEPEAVPI